MLSVGMGKYEKMAKSGCRSPVKGRPGLKPQGVTRSKRYVKTIDARPKSQKYSQRIVHDRVTRGCTVGLDTGAQQSMVVVGGWEIIMRHDTWIDAQGVNMGVYSKAWSRLQLVDARGVVKKFLDGKRYLVILIEDFFNPNSDETLLVEYQIKCYGVKLYLCPRVFGGKKLIETRDHVGPQFKIGISWYRSTRYLDVSPPTR